MPIRVSVNNAYHIIEENVFAELSFYYDFRRKLVSLFPIDEATHPFPQLPFPLPPNQPYPIPPTNPTHPFLPKKIYF